MSLNVPLKTGDLQRQAVTGIAFVEPAASLELPFFPGPWGGFTYRPGDGFTEIPFFLIRAELD